MNKFGKRYNSKRIKTKFNKLEIAAAIKRVLEMRLNRYRQWNEANLISEYDKK